MIHTNKVKMYYSSNHSQHYFSFYFKFLKIEPMTVTAGHLSLNSKSGAVQEELRLVLRGRKKIK